MAAPKSALNSRPARVSSRLRSRVPLRDSAPIRCSTISGIRWAATCARYYRTRSTASATRWSAADRNNQTPISGGCSISSPPRSGTTGTWSGTVSGAIGGESGCGSGGALAMSVAAWVVLMDPGGLVLVDGIGRERKLALLVGTEAGLRGPLGRAGPVARALFVGHGHIGRTTAPPGGSLIGRSVDNRTPPPKRLRRSRSPWSGWAPARSAAAPGSFREPARNAR
jgi:hypothetical protein